MRKKGSKWIRPNKEEIVLYSYTYDPLEVNNLGLVPIKLGRAIVGFKGEKLK